MARVIKMPRMGEGMEEGQIVSWMANVGAKGEKGREGEDISGLV